MIYQMDKTILEPFLTVVILFVLLFMMLILYLKYRIWSIITTVYAFSLILGSYAFSVETPLSPYFEVFFLIICTVIFIKTCFDAFSKYKEVREF